MGGSVNTVIGYAFDGILLEKHFKRTWNPRPGLTIEGYFYQEGRSVNKVFEIFLSSDKSTCVACWDYTLSSREAAVHTCAGLELGEWRGFHSDFYGEILYPKLNAMADSFSPLTYIPVTVPSEEIKITNTHRKNAKPFTYDVISFNKLHECREDLNRLKARLEALGLEVPEPTIGVICYE